MSTDNTNIWDVAEAYVSGAMNDTDKAALLDRLQHDTNFAATFHESVNMLRSLTGSGEHKRFRSLLREVAEDYKKANRTKTISFRTDYWRVAAMAAGIAILTSFGTYWSVNRPDKKNTSDYTNLRHEIENIKRSQNRLIEDIKDKTNTPPAQVRYTGTGFAITNDGYLVTNYHVVDGADSIYIQNHDQVYFKASVVFFDRTNDIAILKIHNKNFRFGKADVPYTFASGKSNLGARIFTLGYPEDDVIYNEGYISGKNGFNSDTLQYRLELPTQPGQSGSPVLDEKGNILGIVTARGNQDEGNTYAVSSDALLQFISTLPKEDVKKIHLNKINRLRNLSREQQVQKLEFYTCSVKVYKK